MAHKVQPKSFRLRDSQDWDSRWLTKILSPDDEIARGGIRLSASLDHLESAIGEARFEVGHLAADGDGGD